MALSDSDAGGSLAVFPCSAERRAPDVNRGHTMRTFTRVSSIAALLRIVAIFLILDGGVFFLPERWINSFLTSFVLEPMPRAVFLSYLLQAAGYLQIAIGALIWVIATDVVRYRPLVITTITIFLVGAPVFYLMDARIGLPDWWCVMDFISAFLCGAFPLAFCLWPAKTPPKTPQPTDASPDVARRT
jgi:hypothetical protein